MSYRGSYLTPTGPSYKTDGSRSICWTSHSQGVRNGEATLSRPPSHFDNSSVEQAWHEFEGRQHYPRLQAAHQRLSDVPRRLPSPRGGWHQTRPKPHYGHLPAYASLRDLGACKPAEWPPLIDMATGYDYKADWDFYQSTLARVETVEGAGPETIQPRNHGREPLQRMDSVTGGRLCLSQPIPAMEYPPLQTPRSSYPAMSQPPAISRTNSGFRSQADQVVHTAHWLDRCL